MSPDNSRETDIRALIGALIRLNGLSISKAADQAGINRSNAAGWLKGRAGALSGASQAKLAESLGLIGGHLRTDWIHEWLVESSLEDLKTVLEASLNEEERAHLTISPVPVEQDQGGGAILTLAGDKVEQTLVLTVQPSHRGLTMPEITSETLGFGVAGASAGIYEQQAERSTPGQKKATSAGRAKSNSLPTKEQEMQWLALLGEAMEKGWDFYALENIVRSLQPDHEAGGAVRRI